MFPTMAVHDKAGQFRSLASVPSNASTFAITRCQTVGVRTKRSSSCCLPQNVSLGGFSIAIKMLLIVCNLKDEYVYFFP